MLDILGFILIVISPLLIGLPWITMGGAKGVVSKVSFAYVSGFFLRHTLFHLVAMPMTVLGVHFSVMSTTFTIVLLVVCVFSTWVGRKSISLPLGKCKWTKYEVIYLMIFAGLLAVQLYITVFMDITYMNFDDASYTVYSTDALATDNMMITDPYTGVFMRMNHRFIQSSLLFPAYIAKLTGMPVATIERTFSYSLNLLMAYGSCSYMAEDLYEKRENRFIFLIFVSLLYLFGYYSHYSMTFRLLGANSHGKAILAVIMIPLLFVMFRKKMDQQYDWKFGLFLLLLSISAVSLSLMGAGYMICITGSMSVLAIFCKKREWKKLLYFLWGSTLPCIYICIFLFMKYYV